MKTFCLFWLFFIMCPERTIQSESEENDGQTIIISKRLSSIPEPGFDLSEEEMIKFKIWPNGIIPYFIDDYSFDLNSRRKLRTILESFNDVTGLGFMELVRPPQDDDQRWVFIVNRLSQLSCEDYTTKSFTNAGVQKVVLGYDCLNGGNGGALATLVLALAGVPPQHNAPDRDRYIEVKMENIMPEKRHLFEALKNGEWLFHDLSYDYLSAGHYDFHKYSANGQATILPKEKLPAAITIGEEDGLSGRDILKIKMIYNFISLNRKIAKSSDCSLLFKPGNSFKDFKSLTKNLITPRNKPNKYLGIADISDENIKTGTGDENNSVTNGNDGGYDNNTDENDNAEIDRLVDYEVDALNEKRQKLHSKALKHTNNKGKDKLGDLSDFDTDDDRNRQSNKKGRHMLKAKAWKKNQLKSKFHRGDKKSILHTKNDVNSSGDD